MMDSLSEAFRRYTELVLAALRKHDVFDEHLRKTGISLLRPDRRIEFLPQVVEQLEGQKAFHWLLEETEAAFPDQSHTREISHVERATKHFFRRSAFYLDIFERRDIDIDRAFESYVKAFQKQEIPVRDLIPFEYVNFTFPSSRIKFDSFQILRFSEA